MGLFILKMRFLLSAITNENSMKIELTKPFARNSRVDEYDVRQIKKALNRLGYYAPLESTGITGIPDAAVFQALKTFQQEHGLSITGSAKPNDDTVQALNREAAKTPSGSYIWRTVEDDKVRSSHVQYNRQIREWADAPDPGEEFNCRCWAEPYDARIEEIYDPPLEPVYPEMILIPALKLGRILQILTKILRPAPKKENYTEHGALRSNLRRITQKDIQEAMRTAKETGNVTTKIGKYGTPQNVYKGSNGLTVIEETQGRNAGKIITLWWN
jgi:peptidoglycan hydrolase-like protein with peptidoglycan-binding domain